MASLSPPTASAGRRRLSDEGLNNWWQLKDALRTTSLEVRAQKRAPERAESDTQLVSQDSLTHNDARTGRRC